MLSNNNGRAQGRAKVRRSVAIALSLVLTLSGVSASAQVATVDPDASIDSDLGGVSARQNQSAQPVSSPTVDAPDPYQPTSPSSSAGNGTPATGPGSVYNWKPDSFGRVAGEAATNPESGQTTYHKDDLIGAAEGVFGKGAKGLAELIADLLAKQGEPNGYIVGREGGGAFAFGLRYGSGTLYHRIEGQRPVYWTGPSLGFDAGANASSAFVLVYNLNDTQDLYHRFGQGEGQAYLIGGFTVSYLRRGNIVLIPVRSGAGLRLGANIGYMKFTEKQTWVPF